MKLSQFLKLDNSEIYKLVKKNGKPRNIAIMLDGTRRLLKLQPKYHTDHWLYHQNHIEQLIYKSVDIASLLFNLGATTVTGPLISIGNFQRKDFVPMGLNHLLEPLTKTHCTTIFKKQNIAVSFYGLQEHLV
jgi:undecaprenyl pyrophosphate synthase